MKEYRLSMAALLEGHTDASHDLEACDFLEERDFIERVAMRLYERYEQFSRWPDSVRQFYACYELNFQVGNGGFAQAAYNVPHLIPVAQAAFERFNRPQAAELCQRAVSLLPAELAEHITKGFTGGEPLEAVFAHFDESALKELGRDIPSEFWADTALQKLVEQNRADFASIDSLA